MIIVWVWQLVKKKQLAKEMALGCLGGTHTIDLILKRQTVVARVGAKQLPWRWAN